MRPTLSAALSAALIAAPAVARTPCDALAAAIDARFETGAPAAAMGRALAEDAIPGAVMPAFARADVRLGGTGFRAADGARRAGVPHVPGVRFVELREGSARCQVFALYRAEEGGVRALAHPPVGGDGALCAPDALRPVGVAGRGYLAHVRVHEARIDLYPVARTGAARAPVCRVVLETRLDGRIEAPDPNDAASIQARRPALAELEPALPELVRALRTGAPWRRLPEHRDRDRGPALWTFEFSAGAGRYAATLSDAPGGVSVRLARIFPELGNRERPLGGFVYAGEPRFVRALSGAPELR
ncbi:MAG: hypothetical protein ING19_04745 [Azospirillum sp.]|nr:hypothetical protein [Azospirillum sp.]MCZ8124462.1 hypothetical protein [Magnetospirillum sp.]